MSTNARIPHLTRAGARGVAGAVGDLFSAVRTLESGAEVPVIDVVGAQVIDISDIAAGEPLPLTGRNFLNGSVNASVVVQPATGTDTLLITANRPGVGGNDISIEFVDSTAGNLAVTETAGAIQVDWGGDTPNLDATLVNAINANTAGGLLVTASIVGSAGSGTLATAIAAANLEGGEGVDFVLEVGGLAQSVDAVVTETSCAGLIDDNTGTPMAATDTIGFRVVANGRASAMSYLAAQA